MDLMQFYILMFMNMTKFLLKLLLCFVTILFCGCSNSPAVDSSSDVAWEPVGRWVDGTNNWYVEFTDSQYRESTFNLWRSYTYEDGTLTIEDPCGESIDVPYTSDSNGVILEWFDGTHSIRECSDQEWSEHSFFVWDNHAILSDLLLEYDVMSGRFKSSILRLYEGDEFECSFVVDDETIWYQGKYILNGTSLYLIYDEGEHVDEMFMYPDGVYGMPLTSAIDSIDRDGTVRIFGQVYDDLTGIEYDFDTMDNLVKVLPSGETLSYYYDINDGVVTIRSRDNADPTDCMYFDKDSLTMYRIVYERNSWNEFVKGGLFGETME